MKKIIYVVDYLHNEHNSVAEILKSILKMDNKDFERIVVHHQGNQNNTFIVREIEGIKTYSAKEYSGFVKILKRFKGRIIGYKSQKQCNEEYISNIFEIECPDLVFFILFNPEKGYVKECKDMGIPYIYMLYDTYIGRPELDCDILTAEINEKNVIEESIAYFVPSFFYTEYKQHYESKKISPYNLPLLVDINAVKKSFEKKKIKYNLTYFGQVQSFRNAEKIKQIFHSLNLTLDIFTQSSIESDDTFIIHPTVNGDNLYTIVAQSKFLIAFDNSYPYDRYLPSKVYLYISFTKPIIAFGDNKESALLDFFKDYPFFYYQNIHDNTDGLIRFISKFDSFDFKESIYKRYIKYLPENALTMVKQVTDKTINP